MMNICIENFRGATINFIKSTLYCLCVESNKQTLRMNGIAIWFTNMQIRTFAPTPIKIIVQLKSNGKLLILHENCLVC